MQPHAVDDREWDGGRKERSPSREGARNGAGRAAGVRRLGLAVGAVTVGLISMASAGHLWRSHRGSSAAQRAAYESLWGPGGGNGAGSGGGGYPPGGWAGAPPPLAASGGAGLDYRASVEELLAQHGAAAFADASGRTKHYVPVHEARSIESALHTTRLDEEPAGDGGDGGNQPLKKGHVPLQEVDFTPPAGFDYKVLVEVYMESQGQASKLFTEWVLVQVVGAPGMTSIINLMMFPWGQCSIINRDIKRPVSVDVEYIDNYTATNVTLRSGWPAFLCEHGPSECEGNAIMSCVQALYPELEQWFRVDACIVARACADGEAPLVDSVAHTGAGQQSVCRGKPVDVAPQCIRDFGEDMDLRNLSACVRGKQGTELLLQNMVQTQTLVPPIKTLPWILVDQEVLNYPNRSHIFLLGKSICDAYVRKVQPFVNGSVPRPLGCYYFPTEPPYMPPITLWDDQGILFLWVGGGVCFLLGVCMLVGWKYYALSHEAKYREIEEPDDREAP